MAPWWHVLLRLDLLVWMYWQHSFGGGYCNGLRLKSSLISQYTTPILKISNGLQKFTKARFRQLPTHIVPDHRAQTPDSSRRTSPRQPPAFWVKCGHIGLLVPLELRLALSHPNLPNLNKMSAETSQSASHTPSYINLRRNLLDRPTVALVPRASLEFGSQRFA